MKRTLFSFLLVAMVAFTITSCREKNPGEKIEDVGDGIEDAVDDVVN